MIGGLKQVKNSFDEIPDDAELTREQFYGKFFRSIKKARGVGELKTKCLACHKIFSTKNRKFHALHNHATFRPLKCELCPSKFFTSNKRMFHMGNRHPTDYRCSQCSQQYDRAHIYALHMLNEHKMTVKVPTIDQNEINVPNHIMRYTKKVTAVRAMKAQKRMENVIDVSGTDSEASSFFLIPQDSLKCAECYEEFDSSRSLRIHMRNHTNSSTFAAVAAEIAKTREVKTLDYIHQCDLCEKKFSAMFALNAHKKFRHSIETPTATKKRKAEKTKYDVECDICDFTSFRRDYVEHHVRAAHKLEFQCRHCSRIMSNSNHFLYHLSEFHPKAKDDFKTLHKCTQCEKLFKTVEGAEQHQESKHKRDVKIPENYCEFCGVVYNDALGFEVHQANHKHKALQTYFENRPANTEKNGIKEEPVESDAMVIETRSSSPQDETEKDPFTRMLEQKIQSPDEPPPKRTRFIPSRFAPSRLSILVAPTSNDDDKLEYLKYLQCVNGEFKCGICGKKKTARKYMLHHLKQHKEVPTYSCDKCPEKFVFKKKYEKHLEIHNELVDDIVIERVEMNVDEHPKFQETATKNTSNEIRCELCDVSFKLTIMLNRHNSTWHAVDNPDKEMSMNDQKAKKEEPKQELAILKLLRCKHCLEAFIRPVELKEHLKEKHNSESIDQPIDCEATQSTEQSDASKFGTGAFPCDRCKFMFKEKKFLENHQKFFCIGRQGKSDANGAEVVINEQ